MIYIAVFSKLFQDLVTWSKRHSALSNLEDSVRVIGLVEENVSESALACIDIGLYACVSGENYTNRVRSLAFYLRDEDYLLVCASDDHLVRIGFPNGKITPRWIGLQPTCYFGSQHRPAVSNQMFVGLDHFGADARLQRYFSIPFPGDNSIYYGMFVFRNWRDSFDWSVDAIGGVEKIEKFHAFDWLWMSRLIYSGPLHSPTDSFVISRSENNWKKYHDVATYEENDFINSNPLLPLIKILTRAYPDIDLDAPLYAWFATKIRERCAITGEKIPLPEVLRAQFLSSLRLD